MPSRLSRAALGLLLTPVVLVAQVPQERPTRQSAVQTIQAKALSTVTLVGLAQTAPSPSRPATATIRGRVVGADDGRPLRRAQVEVWPDPPVTGTVYQALTDEAGRYEIAGVVPGRYRIEVSKSSYVTVGYGQKTPSSPRVTIDLKGGQLLNGIDVALPRGGVIAGTILDEAGEPMSGARVSVARLRYVDWEPQVRAQGTPVVTDDLGRFRAFGFAPGHYYVWATTTSSVLGTLGTQENRLGYQPTYYPGTAMASEARALTLGAGEQIPSIALAMRPGGTASISGVLQGLNNERTLVSLTPSPLARSLASGVSMSVLVAPGPFAFQGVTPGEYRVTATGPTGGRVYRDVVLNAGDSATVTLAISPGTTLRGRVVFATVGTAITSDAASATLVLIALDGSPVVGKPPPVAEDGSFEWPGVDARRILLRASATGWALARVSRNGIDVTDEPIELNGKVIEGIEVALSRTLSEVAGTVANARGAVVPNATVVVFADDPSKWGRGTRFAARAATDAQGRFSIRGLPPERYVAVAVEGLEAGDDTNPEVLHAWRITGTRVTLGEGASQVLRLRVF